MTFPSRYFYDPDHRGAGVKTATGDLGADQSVVKGRGTLTPIQKWLFDGSWSIAALQSGRHAEFHGRHKKGQGMLIFGKLQNIMMR